MAFFSFILVFIPVVLIHELGHWIVGLLLGAKPQEFSIGFGKKLFSFSLFGTIFKVSLIPLGGYVSFSNYQFHHEKQSENHERLHPLKWVLISLAGPMANFVLTFFIFVYIIFSSLSSFEFYSHQNSIVMNRVGESILDSVVGKEFFEKNYIQYNNHIISKLPKENAAKLSKINISWGQKIEESSFWSYKAMSFMLDKTVDAFQKILIPSNYDKKAEIMGPIGIMKASKESSDKGFDFMLILIGSLSFAVAFFNLIPLSILDGGRAALGMYEFITSSNVNAKLMNFFNKVSVSIVFGLVVFATISDLNIF